MTGSLRGLCSHWAQAPLEMTLKATSAWIGRREGGALVRAISRRGSASSSLAGSGVVGVSRSGNRRWLDGGNERPSCKTLRS